MKDVIGILKKCQECDIEMYELKEKLEEVPRQLAEVEAKFEEEKAALHEMEERLKQTKVSLKDKENDLKAKEEQSLKYAGQQSQVKTNKEYAALQGEIDLLKKQCSEIEEAVIISLDEIAGIEKEISSEKTRLDAKRVELDQEKEVFLKDEKEAKARIEELMQIRAEAIKGADQKVVALYERISEKRRGRALAPIKGENCGGCGSTIRPQLINEVRMCDQAVMCEACQRILYVDE